MENQKKSKKFLFILIPVIIAVVVAVVLFFISRDKNDAYRIIKVYELEGDVIVTRDGIGEMEAYPNMVLESGDYISVGTGSMTLKLDDDKYVYVENNTSFSLVATGSSSNSKTTIELEEGAITNEIQNPLSKDSSYEINTPNSNMAVRGTIFRVHTYVLDGVRYTKVSVFEGKVASRLIYEDGTMSEETVLVENGKEVIIYNDSKTTDYLEGPRNIDYYDLPDQVILLLIDMVEAGTDIGMTVDELEVYLDKAEDDDIEEVTTEENEAVTYQVTFMYNGAVFGTQTVAEGECAMKPILMPAASGSWDFDFDTPINEDTTIEWR